MHMTGTTRANIPAPQRRRWEEPRLQFVGHLADIVQSDNKLTVTPGDPGENRCSKTGPC
jgi:hypothetical protein